MNRLDRYFEFVREWQEWKMGDYRRAQPEENKMISPTVGRVVWYREIDPKSVEGPVYFHEQAAIVTHVHGDRLVNLAVFDCNGVPFGRTSVRLQQEGDEDPGCSYCEWMPYQKGQAAKTEALEAKLAK